jgi:hypothetical protein
MMHSDFTLNPNGDEQHRQLIAMLIKELFLDQRRVFAKWARITNQSTQLDSGYIAQHLISLLTGVLGTRRRGKGLDLSDGSEVQSANSVDGIDVPRWNHNLGRPGKVDEWLKVPRIYYVLFDTTKHDKVRVRVWVVNPSSDRAYQTVIGRWRSQRSSGNFQIHPPVGRDDNIGTNLCGNLEFPLMLKATESDDGTMLVNFLDLLSTKICRLIERD